MLHVVNKPTKQYEPNKAIIEVTQGMYANINSSSEDQRHNVISKYSNASSVDDMQKLQKTIDNAAMLNNILGGKGV